MNIFNLSLKFAIHLKQLIIFDHTLVKIMSNFLVCTPHFVKYLVYFLIFDFSKLHIFRRSAFYVILY